MAKKTDKWTEEAASMGDKQFKGRSPKVNAPKTAKMNVKMSGKSIPGKKPR